MLKRNTHFLKMTVVMLVVSMILTAIPFVYADANTVQTPVNEVVTVSGHATNILLSAGKEPTNYKPV